MTEFSEVSISLELTSMGVPEFSPSDIIGLPSAGLKKFVKWWCAPLKFIVYSLPRTTIRIAKHTVKGREPHQGERMARDPH